MKNREQGDENGESTPAEHLSLVEEVFNFSPSDNYAILPAGDDNGGSNMAAAEDQFCSAVSSSTAAPPLPPAFSNNNSCSNTQFSNQLTCSSRLPGHDLCEPVKTHIPTYTAEVDFESMLFSTTELMVPDQAIISCKPDHDTACTWSPYLDLATKNSSLVHSDSGIIKPNFVKPPVRKRETSPDGVARRCQHCATEKTPQWRAGPMGPKSLCNACGVRYKSGRLLPEYRPASSPTFAVSEHSNSHKKVAEIRRQKGIPTPLYPPLYEGKAAPAREGAAATGTEVANPGHNFLNYGHQYLSDFLQNF